jgi:hypothetical protein
MIPTGQEAGWASEPVWTQRLEEKSLPRLVIEPRSPGRPVCSQALYWLSYPGSWVPTNWQSIPGQRQAKSFLSKLSDKTTVKLLKLNRSQAWQVTGLLTGHCHLQGHIFKLGISDNHICWRCYMERGTVSHILCEWVVSAGLTFPHLGKHFMELSDYDEILLRYCTSLEVRDYWRYKEDGYSQQIRKWSQCKGRLCAHTTHAHT